MADSNVDGVSPKHMRGHNYSICLITDSRLSSLSSFASLCVFRGSKHRSVARGRPSDDDLKDL